MSDDHAHPELEAQPQGEPTEGGRPLETPAATLPLNGAHHRTLVAGSEIDPEVVAERGYFTATTKTELRKAGLSDYQARNLNIPGILMPVHTVSGGVGLHIYRPDTPAPNAKGSLAKYVMLSGCSMTLDVPPRSLPHIAAPDTPLIITEGTKKVDAAVSRGIVAIALLGVWNWRGKNGLGGKTALPDWERVALDGRKVYLCFDSDVMEKLPVYRALVRIRDFLKSRGANVRVVYLPGQPDGGKVGLDDWFVDEPGRTFDDLTALSQSEVKPPPGTQLEADRVVGVKDAPSPEQPTPADCPTHAPVRVASAFGPLVV